MWTLQPHAFTTKSLFQGHMDYKYLRLAGERWPGSFLALRPLLPTDEGLPMSWSL